jgi:hypothetical protein
MSGRRARVRPALGGHHPRRSRPALFGRSPASGRTPARATTISSTEVPACLEPGRRRWPHCERAVGEADVSHVNAGACRSGPGRAVSRPAPVAELGDDSLRKIVSVPVSSLRPGQSPRLEGEDKAHIARLAQSEAALPPILVSRRGMRVIDGAHRLIAASLNGQKAIDVEFFDGTEADAFLRAVEANVTHGLPLSQADRRAAAARIITSHPRMSDRAIADSAGLAARTVAAIRRRSAGAVPQPETRVGMDGRVRPLSCAEGRRRAAELMAEHPRASLREVARGAGISPATARDVRKRVERGAAPGARAAAAALAAANLGRGAGVVRRDRRGAATLRGAGRAARAPVFADVAGLRRGTG